MSTDTDFWNGIAPSYAAKPVDDPESFERKIAVTLSHIRPDHRVLDIGCGTGSLALRLAPHAAQVDGLDLSSEMVRIANAKAAEAAVDNVTFHCGPFDEGVPFASGSLHGVCAYSVLHLIEDRSAALMRIHDLLEPGGFFVSSTVCLGGSWVPYGPLLTVMKWVGKAPNVYSVSRDQLVAEVRAAGFEDLETPDVGADSTTLFLVARRSSRE